MGGGVVLLLRCKKKKILIRLKGLINIFMSNLLQLKCLSQLMMINAIC
jgi:hypothetical protein